MRRAKQAGGSWLLEDESQCRDCYLDAQEATFALLLNSSDSSGGAKFSRWETPTRTRWHGRADGISKSSQGAKTGTIGGPEGGVGK